MPSSISTGNTIAANIPFFRSSEAMPDTIPATVGPDEQPISPASASRAKRAVPPFLIQADAILKVPGHIIPTDRPHNAQPIKEVTGDGDNDMHRYEAIQSRLLNIMNRLKLILSPNLP